MQAHIYFGAIVGDNIAAANVGIQANVHTPMTLINIPTYQETLQFRLVAGNSAFTGPTGLLTLTLEFYQ